MRGGDGILPDGVWLNGERSYDTFVILDGVVTYPAHYQEGRRYPLVLLVHGGPNSSSRDRFSLLPQILASHDWLVFEPNYRGSDSQGNAFFAAI